MPISDEAIVTRLRTLLGEVDLQTTSERKLRETIEAELNEDLSDRKALIRQEVHAYLLKQQEEDEESDEEGEADGKNEGGAAKGEEAEEEDSEDEEQDNGTAKNAPRKRKRKSAFGSKLSAELQEFLGETSMPRTEVVKKLWEYIKENNLQNPKNKRKIILDDKLKKIFKPPLDMFNMNKQLSKHVYVDDTMGDEADEAGDDDNSDDDMNDDEDEAPQRKKRRKPAAQKGAKTKEPAKRSRAASDGAGGGSALSPAMQEFLGVKRLARPQVVKQLWAYIKNNNLQDPKDKRNILLDEKLGTLFEAPLNMFTINKQVSKHIL